MSNNSTSRRSFRDLFGQRMLCRLSGLLTLCWFTVAAQALYAQSPVISLTLKNATVREVIEAVKTQSGYSFWYRESEIDLRTVLRKPCAQCGLIIICRVRKDRI